MSFRPAEYLRLRPFSYHVTARENLLWLRRSRRLEPSAELLAAADRPDVLRERRTDYVTVRGGEAEVVLKDQLPLIAANVELTGGWTFADFVEHLNRHVFFWPGTEEGPIGTGRRLLRSYADDSPAVIRVPTADLFTANESLEPLFCPFNSGAPRYHSGKPAPRGPDLYAPAGQFPRRASEVVELVFSGSVMLPSTACIYDGTAWSPL